MSKTIRVVMKHGKPVISTEGFEGDSCLEATKKVEELLSGEQGVEVRDMTGVVVEEYQSIG